jgi:hypothetical protein
MSSIKYITENKYVFLFLVLAGVLMISLFLGVSPNREGMTNGTTTTTKNGTTIMVPTSGHGLGSINVLEPDGTKTNIPRPNIGLNKKNIVIVNVDGTRKTLVFTDSTPTAPTNYIIASVTTPNGITIQKKGDDSIIITTTDGVVTTINKDGSLSDSGT